MKKYELLNAMMACLTDAGTDDQSYMQCCYMCPLQNDKLCRDKLRIEFLRFFANAVEGEDDAEQDS